MLSVNAQAKAKSRADLEYGQVLYEFYQQDYFSALVEFEYASSIDNTMSQSDFAQVLKGGMLLSYGVADEAYDLFNSVLATTETEEVKNRAWYYLAKLFYSKSDWEKAADSVAQVGGVVPEDIYMQYHYLSTLINLDEDQLNKAQETMERLANDKTFYPYLLFNMAIGHIRSGSVSKAVTNLEQVAAYKGSNRELLTLADRARHGLSQLAIQTGNFPQAWEYLRGIQTTGLYSNRALLTFAWSAIKLKRYKEAIPALQALNQRSIAIPEVQEAKVLLSHLYEQEGSAKKALKANLLAEKQYKEGMSQVTAARKLINQRDVPKEFITNLNRIVNDSEWNKTEASVNYQQLTPFLIDLMASNAFNEILNELTDLYLIHENLSQWSSFISQHKLVLNNSYNRAFDQELLEKYLQGVELRDRLDEQSQELRLHTLKLKSSEQKRFEAILEATSSQLDELNEKIAQLEKVEPYKPPQGIDRLVAKRHRELGAKLKTTETYIAILEPLVRKLVNAELDKHEERMQYYWAQSRLAKARLYDETLLLLENTRDTKSGGAK